MIGMYNAKIYIGFSAHQFMQKQKIIYCPISAGELLDKISILQIKQTKINSPESLEYINMELKMLENIKPIIMEKFTHWLRDFAY